MGFWSKLGKIGLAAAPYVAAPFTGGASLMFAPATNQALGAWNQHDAQNRYEQGLGPSSFDNWLGIGSNVAGMATGMGAFGSAAQAGYGGGIGPSWARTAADVGGRVFGGGGGYEDEGAGYGGYDSGRGNSFMPGEHDWARGTMMDPNRWQDTISGIGQVIGGMRGGDDDDYGRSQQDYGRGDEDPRRRTLAQYQGGSSNRGIGPSGRYSNVDFGFDYNNPNIADAIAAGRIQAQRDRGTYYPSSYGGYGGYGGGGRRGKPKAKKKKKLTKKQTMKIGRSNVKAYKNRVRPYAPESMRMKMDAGRGM